MARHEDGCGPTLGVGAGRRTPGYSACGRGRLPFRPPRFLDDGDNAPRPHC